MLDASCHINAVENITETLRTHLLGLDIPFRQLLPECYADFDNVQLAGYLARRLSFEMGGIDPACDVHLTFRWLREMMLYLISVCSSESHILNNLIRLFELSPAERMFLFKGTESRAIYQLLASTAVPPFEKEDLEEACVGMVLKKGLHEKLLRVQESILHVW